MKIELIPGIRDEKKISQIEKARQMLSAEEWKEYCYDRASESEEWLDALYYASEENAETLLETWAEKYLEELTQYDKYSYAADMGGFECDVC